MIDRPETFVEAARYCVLAKDPAELREVLELAEEKRMAPGESCAKGLADAVRSLGLDQDPEAYASLARLIRH